MPFKLSLVADVRGWLKGTADVERSLEDVADSLDELADDTKTSSRDAADTLERRFSDAFDKVKTEARTTGRKIGDDIHDGARRAEDGMNELGDEAGQTAREAAASFTGSAEDIVDAFQEVAANAFRGFGPAGQAAGLLAAAGLGILYTSLEDAADEAADTKQAVIDLADELVGVDGNPAALRWAERLRTTLTQIANDKQWFEFWQDQPTTRLEEWSRKAREYGVDMAQIARAISGDHRAQADVVDQLNRRYETLGIAYRNGDESAAAAMGSVAAFRDELTNTISTTGDAVNLYGQLNDALSGIDDAAADSADATAAYQESVADSLDQAGRGWEKFAKDGRVALADYTDALEEQLAAVDTFEANLTKASSTLTDEALGYLKRLGPEAAPLLEAFLDAPAKEQKRAAAAWDKLGKATSDGYEQGADLEAATARVLADAQAEADDNPIKVETKLDASTLQRDVNAAAAGIHRPTIWVDVKPRKEVA